MDNYFDHIDFGDEPDDSDHGTLECYWTENGNGNYVLRDGRDDIRATVFFEANSWNIVINGGSNGKLVADELFATASAGKQRALKIVYGASCSYVCKSAPNTGWTKQTSSFNGKPTYGRKKNGIFVTVKCASSGSWFYVPYKGPTTYKSVGWFRTAQEAMTAFDTAYQSPDSC